MTCAWSPTGLIPWFSKTRGKYLRYFAASPFPLQGKTNACSRGSKKHFWDRCREIYSQAKTYQVPITNSYPSHYIICHSPLVFLSPTSKTIFENLCLFFVVFPYAFLFVFPCAFHFLASLLAKNLFIWIHLNVLLGSSLILMRSC